MILSPALPLLLLGTTALIPTADATTPTRVHSQLLRGEEAAADADDFDHDSLFTIFPNPFGPNALEEFYSLSAGRPGIDISRGTGDVSAIVNATDDPEHDYKSIIEGLTYWGFDWMADEQPTFVERTIGEMIDLHNMTALLVSHRGRLVYEKYFKGNSPEVRHVLYSAMKSYLGLVAATLVATGVIDETRLVPEYVPELGADASAGAFAEATVRQVMDMSTSIKSVESQANCDFLAALEAARVLAQKGKNASQSYSLYPGCEFALDYNIADGMFAIEPEAMGEFLGGADWPGPTDMHSFLRMVEPGDAAHGERFTYSTPNTDALAWVVDAALRMHNNAAEDDADKLPGTAAEYFQDKIWSKIGAASDFFVTTDSVGTPGWGRGGAVSARDMLRMGEVLLRRGTAPDGSTIIPPEVVDDIVESTDLARKQFNSSPWGEQFEGSYRSHFYSISRNFIYMEGFFGQILYVDMHHDLIVVTNSHTTDYLRVLPDRMQALLFLTIHFANGKVPGPSGSNAGSADDVPKDATPGFSVA